MDGNNTWSANSFYYFVMSVLRQIALSKKQEIFFDATIPSDLSSGKTSNLTLFDAFAPNGLGNMRGPSIFDFKYYASNKSVNMSSVLNRLHKKIKDSHIYAETNIIVVTNIPVNSLNQHMIVDNPYQHNVRIHLWGQETISDWIKQYPIDFSNAINLISPTKSKGAEADITDIDFDTKSQNNITALKQIIETEDNFALVLGAGISVDPGAKTWDSLLKHFTNELKRQGVIDVPDKLSSKIGGSSLTTAQLCKELFPNDIDYFWAIHNGLYTKPETVDSTFALFQIARIAKSCALKSHFRVLTYNFDNYLELYLDNLYVPYNTLYDSNCDINSKLSIYHVHGYLPRVKYKSYMQDRHRKSVYLTEENYNELYNHPYSWQISSQLSFFRENICLFVGCSLADPNIRRLLEMTKKENRTHYAILTKDMMTVNDLVKASNHFARIGIEVVWVKDFSDITNTLQLL